MFELEVSGNGNSLKDMDTLLIGWTTVNKPEAAQKLAKDAVQAKLSCCAQIDGPISSFYQWQGKIERDQEYRLMFKFTANCEQALADWIIKNHPYDTPEWVVFEAKSVSESYLNWASEYCQSEG